MSDSAPSFRQIQAQVETVRQAVVKHSGAKEPRRYGIQSSGRWVGDRRRVVGEDVWEIRQCDSPLEVRIALQEDDPTVRYQVIVTPVDDAALGQDVRLRLAKRRLHRIREWEVVLAFFKARTVDPRIASRSWLPGFLIELQPEDGYPAAPSGTLDAETAWGIVLERKLGLPPRRPDLVEILRWSAADDRVVRLRGAPAEFRKDLVEWIGESSGAAAGFVVRCLGEGGLAALPVGLALEVVFPERAVDGAVRERLQKARGKLEERYLGGATLEEPVARSWARAAVDAVREVGAPVERAGLLERADRVLDELGIGDLAALGSVSPRGFRLRLVRYGEVLSAAIAPQRVSEPQEIEEARRSIVEHARTVGEPRVGDRVRMAWRLVRWLAVATGRSVRYASLADAARAYAGDGGFVDWARCVLRGGEPVRELAEAYGKLLNRVAALRERENEAFARLLGDWAAAGSKGDDLVPVESILERVVAPLAVKAPVLVLVLDGMSYAVLRELLSEILRKDWVEIVQDGAPRVRPGVAAIPSVTEVCRTSLLSGRLRQGTAADEAAGFAEHPALVAASAKSAPPAVFHKAALESGEEGDLLGTVRDAIASPRRVVGVVINAVDDWLDKGAQTDTRWTIGEIKALGPLLYEARSAGRTVVLVSDHGHVVEDRTEFRKAQEGERWRADDGKPAAGEVRLSGPRVVLPASRKLIVPWSERVRYVNPKGGYHGGVSPQEMLVPIVVLRPSTSEEEIPGWSGRPEWVPDWWLEPAAGGPGAAEVAPAPLAQRLEARAEAKTGQLEFVVVDEPIEPEEDRAGATGEPASGGAARAGGEAGRSGVPGTAGDSGSGSAPFGGETTGREGSGVAGGPGATEGAGTGGARGPGPRPSSAGAAGARVPAWIEALLRSPIFLEQRKVSARAPLPDEIVVGFLSFLDERGGKAMVAAIARRLAEPLHRVIGRLAALQRLLNVEGYAILSRDEASGTVELNEEMLREQFELR